ncbi:hypothetical protein BGZ58_007256 [Dissophora ornata]|nr:hypothetical protein BGZ58_007256 [Dissophora ornata]
MEMLSLGTGSPVSSHQGLDHDPSTSPSNLTEPYSNSDSGNGNSARQRRFKAQNKASVTTIASSMLQTAATTADLDAKGMNESTSQSNQLPTPSMPTPLSPMTSFPDGRVLHHSWQRSSFNIKQEIAAMEHVSSTSNATAVGAMSTPTSASANSSTHLYDLLPMSSSPTEPDPVFGQHQRVLSATSQDSRGRGGWGGHSGNILSSPIPKSMTRTRCLSGNSSASYIVSSLSVQSAPRSERLSTDHDGAAVAIEMEPTKAFVASANPSYSIHASPEPETNITEEFDKNSSLFAAGDLIGSVVEMYNEQDEADSDVESGRPATCPHCGKEFQSKGLLRSHVVSHSSDRPFVCWDCTDKSYKRNHDLLRHRREKHNVDGAIVPARGSGRSHGGARESASNRTSNQPTVASQSHIPHHEMFYPSQGMIYLGNGSALSDLPSSPSGSPLDPYGGIEYTQHHPSHSLYSAHHSDASLGLGLEISTYGSKDFLSGLNLVAGGAIGSGRGLGSGRRASRGGRAGASSPASTATGRKRKFSNSSSTTPTLISPAAIVMMPPPTPVVSGPPTAPSSSAAPSTSQQYHPTHQLAALSGAFENMHANMGHFGGGGGGV